MKNTTRPRLLSLVFLVAGIVGFFVAAAPAVIAQDAAPASALVLDAETGLPVKATPDAAPVSAPWWSGPEVISAVIALATGLIAVWQRKEKKTAQKVSESLVLAIEAATKIPAVGDKEKAIKARIRTETERLGVAPLVHRLVKDLT